MNTQRAEKRFPLIYYLAVFDRDTDDLVGYLADISVDGVKLLCDQPVPPGVERCFRVESYLLDDPSHTIDFNAECRWTSPDKFVDYHDCGFHFTRIESSHINAIRTIIDKFSLDS